VDRKNDDTNTSLQLVVVLIEGFLGGGIKKSKKQKCCQTQAAKVV
jgi:hypothetical protein